MILGLDIGGAHLKAALIDENGAARWVMQLPCPLWRGLDYLERSLSAVMGKLAQSSMRAKLAVTMTGELADIFHDRRDGVLQLSACVARYADKGDLIVYGGVRGFVGLDAVEQHVTDIASANWMASAEFAAAQVAEGLFVDMGSTTTDMLMIRQHKVCALGFSDAERLRTEELVYTGVVRTPVMAVTQGVMFQHVWQGIAAEHFATMSDVYRLTGELDETHDMADTADGMGKTGKESARRLARMVGRDLSDADMKDWRQLADNFKSAQLGLLTHAAQSALQPGVAENVPLIGAGAGRFLVRQLAAQMGRSYVDVADLVQGDAAAREWAAVCVPAYAVAWLAQRKEVWQH